MNNVGDETIIASFVPSFLRERFSVSNDWKLDGYSNDSEAVLLWLDVYNFSVMCNRLTKEPESGVNKISSILHLHYEFLLKNIIQYGGTPLFFVGDGLMAFWPTNSLDVIKSFRLAVTCAFNVLEQNETFDDKNERISIHAVIAYGSWKMKELNGPHGKKLFSYFGNVFNELRSASKNRAPNKVLIRNLALEFIEEEVITKQMEYNTSILVKNPFSQMDLKKNRQVNWSYSKEVLKRIQQFVPTTLNLPLSRERLSWVSELRPVSVVFLRFDNSMENSEAKVHDMDDLANIITPLVEKHDGLLNMIWMDEKATNVLICFGPAPSAHIDNPLRSCKLAFEMNDVLGKKGYDSSIGIGSGIAYCGVLGNDNLRQYTIIGDVVNLSSRYAAITAHGIVCDETTYKATKKYVEFKPAIEVSIKGESKMIRLFPISSIGEEDAKNLKNDSSSSIGRDKELNQIIDCFNKRNHQSSPIAILNGESGMGKSTLRKDFISQINREELIYSNSAVFIERQTPYYIWNEVFTSILGLKSGSTSTSRTAELNEIHERFGEKSCLLNVVLHTSFPESDWFRNLTAANKVNESHNLLLEILRDISNQRKLIFMFDDANWIDEISWRLIKSINSEIGNTFMILSIEGESDKNSIDYNAFSDVTYIKLKELDEDSLRKLFASKIGTLHVSDEIIALAKKVAKGNPLFSLEFINSLLEEDLIIVEKNSCELSKDATIGDHSLPETVRAALRRRIDKMDSGSQLTLKVGSVVGYKFGKEIIGDIYPIMNERHYVSSYLEEAKSSGFLNDTIVDNYDGYLFNNSAIADVSYESILADQKKFLHKKSALWYEKNFEDYLQPFHVRLANHWNQAGHKSKSIFYYKQESTRLFGLGFIRQALLIGLEGLKILNYDLTLDKESIGSQIAENSNVIQMLMKNRSISSLLNQKELESPETDQLIEFMIYLSPMAHVGNEPELFALLGLICQRITLEKGNGKLAAMVYAMYSIIYKAFTNDSATSLEWSNLAIAVDIKNNCSYESSVLFIHGWFIAHWMTPVRTLIPVSKQGADAGFKSGDILYACFNLSFSIILMNMLGIKLDKVIDAADENILRNNNQVVNAAFHLKHEKQLAKVFQGKTESYTSFSDDQIDEEKEIAIICDSDMYNQMGYYYISKLKLNAHFGNWQQGIEWGDKAYPLLMTFASQPGQIDLEFYYGLASLYCAAEKEGKESVAHLERANDIIDTISKWSKLCPDNFLHKYLILKAVRFAFEGEHENANQFFIEAAMHARNEKFYHEEGLAYEHLVRMKYTLNQNYDKDIQKAITAYNAWGAQAKIDYLKAQFLS